VDYVIKCSKMNYGMTYKQILQLADDYGSRLQCKFPSSWTDKKIAGIAWVQGFIKKLNSVALVRERTIPTERPPPVGEVSANFCG